MPIYPENALIMAPLSGYTDLPYRRALRAQGCRFAFTEMIDAASLFYASKNSSEMLRRGAEEEFLGVQLLGANQEFLRRAVDIINEYDFSIVDFNLGCPVPKAAKKGAGAELGRHIDEALSCFAIIAERSTHPVTAKIRILDSEDPAPTLELTNGLAKLGAQAITIHGRIKEAFYSGAVNFEIIRLVREALPGVQIIANGGITCLAKYQEMISKTGCSQVMLARGAMGNPWLFQELTQKEAYIPPSIDEWISVVREHINDMITFYGEERALKMARKILNDYLKGRGFHTIMKNLASMVKTRADFEALMLKAKQEHSESYWAYLETNPSSERRLRR